MKRRLVLLPILGLLLGACAPGLPESVTVSSVSGETTIEVGETLQLKAEVLPSGADQTVTWSSGNPSIATVSETGLVTGVADGVVQIRAGVTADISGSISITVEDNTPTPPVGEVVTIAEAIAEGAGANVVVEGVIIAKATGGMLIADETGTLYRHDYDTEAVVTQPVGELVRISGALSEYPAGSGIMQFDYQSSVTAGEGTKPTISDTPVVWDGAAVDAYTNQARAILVTVDAHVTATYDSKYDEYEYTANVDGATKTIELGMPSSVQLETGDYEITGYVNYTRTKSSGQNVVNMLYVSHEGEGGGDVPPVGEVVTIAEAIAEGAGANVVVEGVIIAKATGGMLIADETGTLYRHDYDTEAVVTQPVGELVRISGALSEYPTGSGTMQFNYQSSVTAGEGTKPTISDTPVVWDGAAVDAYTNQARAILVTVDAHVTATYDSEHSEYEYTANVDGATKTIELGMPSSVQLETGDYTVTGYVNYTRTNSSGQNVVNMLYVSHEGEGGGDVPPTPSNYDISQVTTANQVYTVRGLVVAKNRSALVISDGDDSLYIYDRNLVSGFAIGDYVEATGSVNSYNGALQMEYDASTPASVTKLSETHNIVIPEPTPLTAEIADSWKTADAFTTKDVKEYTWEAVAGKSGNYDTLNIAGSDTTIEPVYLDSSAYQIETGMPYTVTGYFIGYYNYASIVLTDLVEGDLPNPTAVEITNTETSLMQGNTLQLNLAWTPSPCVNDVTWTSSNDEIATVSETGLVTAVAAGEVDITVTSTVVATVTDTIHLTVTAAVASELLVEMDFSSLATSQEMDATTLQQVLIDSATTINDPGLIVTVTNTAKVYSGGAGGYHSQGSTGYLKFGTGSAQGKIDVTLSREIVRVEIDCVKWNDSAKDTFAINGVARDGPAAKTAGTTTLTAEEFSTLGWNLDATTDLSLVVTNRGYVAAIRLYVAAA